MELCALPLPAHSYALWLMLLISGGKEREKVKELFLPLQSLMLRLYRLHKLKPHVESRLTKKHLLFSNCVRATDNQGSWVALYGGQSFLNCKLYNSLLTREVIPWTTVSTGGNKDVWQIVSPMVKQVIPFSGLLGSQFYWSLTACKNRERGSRDLIMRMTSTSLKKVGKPSSSSQPPHLPPS